MTSDKLLSIGEARSESARKTPANIAKSGANPEQTRPLCALRAVACDYGKRIWTLDDWGRVGEGERERRKEEERGREEEMREW